MSRCELGLHLLPLAVFVLAPATFICTYIVAVVLGHVKPDFPYISDTGTEPPESCIFSQLLNICAVLVLCCVYVRYKQVDALEEVPRLNRVSFALGCVSAFGISVVANFQETEVHIVHLVGALLGFGLGNVYCWIQSYMTYKLQPHCNSICVAHTRVLLCVITTATFFSTYVCDTLSKHYFHGDDPRHWGTHDGGFVLHLVSAISEWVMCFAQLLFFVTFVSEFKLYSMSSPEVHFKVAPKHASRFYNSDSIEHVEPHEALMS